MHELVLVPCGQSPRLQRVLQAVPEAQNAHILPPADLRPDSLQNKRVLFSVAVDDCGPDLAYERLIRFLRANPNALEAATGAVLVDGCTELDTKQTARNLIFHANRAGCCFPGKPLVEGTGSLHNLKIQQQKRTLGSLEETYVHCVRDLFSQLQSFQMIKREKPRLLMLHASSWRTSNTLALGNLTAGYLNASCQVQTLCLRNGTVHDCRGCSYNVCAHYAGSGACFYGGSIVDEVFPAVLQADALLLLCPNYNDAVGANIMAFINRLTSLTVSNALAGKSLWGIVVSGYSGGDIVAQQLLGALNANKSLILPPRFCMLETAGEPGEALELVGISSRVQAFADNIRQFLCR